jgi:hypothetical protein
MVFSSFLSTTIFIPADNTRHSEEPGQNPAVGRLVEFESYLMKTMEDLHVMSSMTLPTVAAILE